MSERTIPSNWSKKDNRKLPDGEVLAEQVRQAREVSDQVTGNGRSRHARGVRGMILRPRTA